MAKTLVLRNSNGASPVSIADLGLFIPVGGTIDYTQQMEQDRFLVYASQDLRSLVSSGDIEVLVGGTPIAAASLESFLERYCVLEHNLADDHTGDLPESRIADGNILARLGDNEVVTGDWIFEGNLNLPTEATNPSPVLPAGSIFYNTTDGELYVSDGTSYISYATLADILNHTHSGGADGSKISHSDLIDVNENDHHNRIHDLNGPDHGTSKLDESQINVDGILARVNVNATMDAGVIYNFTQGGIIIQSGTLTNRPVGTIAEGRLYWATDTDQLFVGNGSGWTGFLDSSIFYNHEHNGTDSNAIDHNNLLNKGINTHADIDAHIADTVDPHGAEMTVSGKVITPMVQNSGDVVVDAMDATNPTTIFMKNSGGAGFILRVEGDFQYNGTIDQINTQESLVSDNVITLNSNFPATSVPTTNASLEVVRGTEDRAKVEWDEGVDRWLVGTESQMYKIARIDADETISADWDFTGQLLIPMGDTLPAVAEAKIFWKTDTDDLYLSDGTSWIRFVQDGELANHNHDGVNSAVVSHNNLSDVTPDQHHAQQHDINGSDHTGLLDENKIADGNLLARNAGNETITGDWVFDGSVQVERATSAEIAAIVANSEAYSGRVIWNSETDTLYIGDGTSLNAVAKSGGLLSLTLSGALSNSGTVQDPNLSVKVDDSTIEIIGDELTIKTVPENRISDDGILARLGDNETVTGDWTFEGDLTIPVISGGLPAVGSSGSIIQLASTSEFYISNGTSWDKVITSQNISESIRSRVQFSRTGGCNAGTFLKDGDVVTSFTSGLPVATACTIAGIVVMNDSIITDGSGIEIFKNGGSFTGSSVDIVNGTKTGISLALSESLVAGDFISVRAKTTNGTKLKNPRVIVEIK